LTKGWPHKDFALIDVTSFSAAFHRLAGLTPGGYRRNLI
jgi:hypothetical protein